MKTLDEIIGSNLAFLRTKFGYSQSDISGMLAISQAAYSKYESGINTVPQEALEKLAALYYVEEYDLMQDDQNALKTSLTFAFRGDADLEAMTEFHNIVKNYILMCNELN